MKKAIFCLQNSFPNSADVKPTLNKNGLILSSACTLYTIYNLYVLHCLKTSSTFE